MTEARAEFIRLLTAPGATDATVACATAGLSSLRAGSPSASPCLVADRLREAGLVDAAKAAYTDLLKAADTTVAGARCARAGLGQLGLGTEVPKASAAVACAVPDAFRRVGLDVEAKAAYKQILSSNGPGSAATMCAQRGLDRMRSFGDRFDDVVQALVNGLLGTERSLSPRTRAVIRGIFGGTTLFLSILALMLALRGSFVALRERRLGPIEVEPLTNATGQEKVELAATAVMRAQLATAGAFPPSKVTLGGTTDAIVRAAEATESVGGPAAAVGRAMRAFVTAAVPDVGLTARGTLLTDDGTCGLDVEVVDKRTGQTICSTPLRGRDFTDVATQAAFVVYQVAADRPRVRKRTPTWARWSEPHGASLHSYHQARILYDQGEYAPAAELLRQAVEQEQGNVPIRLNLGRCQFKLGHWDEGLEDYLHGALLAPDYPEAQYRLADAYRRYADAPQRWTTLPAERRQDLRDLISQARGHRTLDPIALLGRPPRLDPDELNDDRIKQDFWALATNQWRVMKQSLRSHSLILHPSRPGVAASRPLFLSRLHWANRDSALAILTASQLQSREAGVDGPPTPSRLAWRLRFITIRWPLWAPKRRAWVRYNLACAYAQFVDTQQGQERDVRRVVRQLDRLVAGKKAPADDLDDLVRLCWTDPDLARLRLEPSQQSEFTKWLRRFSPVPESPANPRAELDRVYTSWGELALVAAHQARTWRRRRASLVWGPDDELLGWCEDERAMWDLVRAWAIGIERESTMTDLHALAGLVHQPQPESTARVAARRLRLGGIADPADCLDRLSTAAQELDDFARGKSYEWTHHRHRVTNALLDANAPTGATDWARDSDRAWTFLHNWAWDPCAVVDPEHLESIVEV